MAISQAEADSFKRLFTRLDEAFSVPAGFCLALHKEDDWSFVIKLHALVEAAVSHLLTTVQGDERLRSVFQQLPLSSAGTGKAAFASALGLLDASQRRFIRSLSELRNRLVHNVDCVEFDLPQYVAQLDKGQRKAFEESFMSWATEGGVRDSWKTSLPEQAKLVIWAAAVSLLLRLMAACAAHTAQHKRQSSLLELAEDLVSNMPDLDPNSA